MKKLIMVAFLITVSTAQASTCWKKVNRIQQMVGKQKTNNKLSKYLCVYFTDTQMMKRAIAISYLESTWSNIKSKSGDDYGLFQFHTQTITDMGLDSRYLMLNLFYQFDTFERFMKHKLDMCKHKAIPEACWYSATPNKHNEYAKKYTAIMQIINKEFP